ncbi:MAG: hypothetical protein VKJ24_02410 [Synechococcales bacterium]|nr:hypothetical protein [Synechococcales bacterium]
MKRLSQTAPSHSLTAQSQPVQYRHLLHEVLFWLISEIILTVTGLDDIANYSEFLLKQADGTWQPMIHAASQIYSSYKVKDLFIQTAQPYVLC